VSDAFKLAAQISGKRAPMIGSPIIAKTMSILATPFDKVLPESYTSEGLRVIAGTTYLGDNSKAKRQLGYNPHPFRESWEETVRHEMKLLGIS